MQNFMVFWIEKLYWILKNSKNAPVEGTWPFTKTSQRTLDRWENKRSAGRFQVSGLKWKAVWRFVGYYKSFHLENSLPSTSFSNRPPISSVRFSVWIILGLLEHHNRILQQHTLHRTLCKRVGRDPKVLIKEIRENKSSYKRYRIMQLCVDDIHILKLGIQIRKHQKNWNYKKQGKMQWHWNNPAKILSKKKHQF